MRPDDANTLRQVRQEASNLAWNRPMHTCRHQPDPPTRLPLDKRVLCNDCVCFWERHAAPISASARLMAVQMESSTASNTCGVAKPAASVERRLDLPWTRTRVAA